MSNFVVVQCATALKELSCFITCHVGLKSFHFQTIVFIVILLCYIRNLYNEGQPRSICVG